MKAAAKVIVDAAAGQSRTGYPGALAGGLNRQCGPDNGKEKFRFTGCGNLQHNEASKFSIVGLL